MITNIFNTSNKVNIHNIVQQTSTQPMVNNTLFHSICISYKRYFSN